MAIYTSIITGGSNNHETTSEEVNAIATDFVEEGVIGAITNTSDVAPMTGAFAVNAQGTPDATVAVTSGIAYVDATPTGQSAQTFRVNMDANQNVTINSNTSGSTKYDWIYIDIDADNAADSDVNASNVATLSTSRSTSASTDDGTPPTYGYPIAVVTVANGFSTITNGNITDKRVRAASVQDGTVDADKLTANTVSSSPSDGGASTSRASITTVEVTAGTWLIVAKGQSTFSVAQDTSATYYLENQTDTTDLDDITVQVDYPGSIVDANVGWSLVDIFVADGTKTIALDHVVNTSSGTQITRNVKLFAIQIGT